MKITNLRPGGTNQVRVFQGAQPVGGAGEVEGAAAAAGAVVGNIGLDLHQTEMREAAEKKRLDEELEKAQTANAALDHEIYVKEITATLENDIATGAVHYKDAESTLQERLKSAPQYKPSSKNKILSESYNRGVQRANFSAGQAIGRASTKAMQSDYKNQFGVALEKMQKLAGLPGADIENINERAQALTVLAKKAGMPDDQLQKTMQDFKDNNWYNQAAQGVMAVSEDPIGLKAIRHELTAADGIYHDKLDASKRTSLLKSVDAHLEKLENRAIHAADKKEAAAERAIDEISKQVSSGVPATPQQWLVWNETVKGTPFEKEFKQFVKDENEVQQLLRKPIEEQMQFLQEKEQDLATNGGDLKKQANVKRIATAVNANVKLLKEDPLLFVQNRTGHVVEPLDLQGMASGESDIVGQMRDRFNAVKALQNRYGYEVSLNPWLPQEAEAMKVVLDKADDTTKLAILDVIARTSPDAQSYGSALKAISADKGMLMLAGMAKFHDLRGSDGRDVAKTILDGERILADKSVIMPTEAAFKVAFEDEVGYAIPNGSPQRLQAFHAFKTIYAGMAADEKVRHSNEDKNIADPNLVTKAIALATGGVVKVNGRETITPYGMGEDTFRTRLDIAITKAAEESGYSKDILEDMRIMKAPGLDDAYVIMNGNKVQAGKDGKPLMLIINDGSVSGKIKK